MVAWDWPALTKVAKLLTIDKAGKHSGEAGFDATNIVQYGFNFGWEGHPNYWGAFMSNGGQMLVPGGSKGSYAAKIPDDWKTTWQWVYDGIGAQSPISRTVQSPAAPISTAATSSLPARLPCWITRPGTCAAWAT